MFICDDSKLCSRRKIDLSASISSKIELVEKRTFFFAITLYKINLHKMMDVLSSIVLFVSVVKQMVLKSDLLSKIALLS